MQQSLIRDIEAVARIEAVPRILEVACRLTGVRFAAIARVTEAQWVACAVRDDAGLGIAPGSELEIETTFCNTVRQTGEAVVFDDAHEDAQYCGHPITAKYGIVSYLSMPIYRGDGSFFGTLCALDSRPARMSAREVQDAFRLFAELIAMHLDTQAQLDASEAALTDERRSSQLREEFIAVLGHDLRNPLASIDAGAKILKHTCTEARETTVLDIIQKSVRRMAGLIDDVMDFARARLGAGLTVEANADEPLEPVLVQVIEELRAAWPQRIIEARIDLPHTVRCDRARIAQLLSNLLANALTHGAPDAPVRVQADTDSSVFRLSVANAGDPIPPETAERLFQPFTRAAGAESQQGLGLGLYIATEIARAHGGTLDVESDSRETRFRLRMPAR